MVAPSSVGICWSIWWIAELLIAINPNHCFPVPRRDELGDKSRLTTLAPNDVVLRPGSRIKNDRWIESETETDARYECCLREPTQKKMCVISNCVSRNVSSIVHHHTPVPWHYAKQKRGDIRTHASVYLHVWKLHRVGNKLNETWNALLFSSFCRLIWHTWHTKQPNTIRTQIRHEFYLRPLSPEVKHLKHQKFNATSEASQRAYSPSTRFAAV